MLASGATTFLTGSSLGWQTAMASGTGSGQLTVVPLSGAAVRFVRITLTGASGNWWSVADVRAYAERHHAR